MDLLLFISLLLLPTFLAIVTDRWKRSQAWYRRSAFQKLKDRLTYIFQWNLIGFIPVFLLASALVDSGYIGAGA